MLRKVVDLITSLKLTIVCLVAGMALIFAGTLAQVHLEIHEAQQRYVQGFFVWRPPESRGLKFPTLPVRDLIGAVLLVYRGETFYQAGFKKDDSASILQVVHNPSFLAPYVACGRPPRAAP